MSDCATKRAGSRPRRRSSDWVSSSRARAASVALSTNASCAVSTLRKGSSTGSAAAATPASRGIIAASVVPLVLPPISLVRKAWRASILAAAVATLPFSAALSALSETTCACSRDSSACFAISSAFGPPTRPDAVTPSQPAINAVPPNAMICSRVPSLMVLTPRLRCQTMNCSGNAASVAAESALTAAFKDVTETSPRPLRSGPSRSAPPD